MTNFTVLAAMITTALPQMIKLVPHIVKSSSSSMENRTCLELKVDTFPASDLFSSNKHKTAALVLYLVISLYLFAAMTLLIHAYLVSGIKILADKLHIVNYSARTTIVIPGILLPEFFCSLISIFVSKGDIGAATVIGSCAANSLLTLGVVGLLLSHPVKLSWYPLWRDNIFYLVTVTILLWTTYDHKLKWQECLFMFLVYFIYLLIINFNTDVERGVRRIVLMYRTGDDEQEADQEIEKITLSESRRNFSRGSLLVDETIPEENSSDISEDADDKAIDIQVHCSEENPIFQSQYSNADQISQGDGISIYTDDGSASYAYTSEGGYLSSEPYNSDVGGYGSFNTRSFSESKDTYGDGDSLASPRTSRSDNLAQFAKHSNRVIRGTPHNYSYGMYYVTLDLNHYANGPSSPFSAPVKWYSKILWCCILPAVCLFHLTIPDCRKAKWKSWYPFTLLISSLWVAFFTYFLLWMTVEIGYLWRIPDSVLGFAFLAAGLSFSKIVTTYLQSKAGYGYKAVYSIYGSNVFNLTINLAFVWFIASIVDNPYLLNSGSIVYINLCQLIIVLTPLLLQFTRWRLNKSLAVVYLILYGGFTAIVILLEYNIIGHFNPKLCNN